ncbi:hypothetical protein VNO77_19266 [Canavalia gladiata]|uniref:Uncharacterized protein n=1 Tax=Canavalia gladiata TaxID=3824 RepID=A0AAN9QKC2_CANGL
MTIENSPYVHKGGPSARSRRQGDTTRIVGQVTLSFLSKLRALLNAARDPDTFILSIGSGLGNRRRGTFLWKPENFKSKIPILSILWKLKNTVEEEKWRRLAESTSCGEFAFVVFGEAFYQGIMFS